MKGDFSRNTFDKTKHYRGVLMQQGRVQLDADWNEQLAIDLHRDQSEIRDLVGLNGAPDNADAGFAVSTDGNTLTIGAGRIYVHGILCENESQLDYAAQSDFPNAAVPQNILNDAKAPLGLVYLDVWNRHITALDDNRLQEKALSGPDTTTRAKTLWQVKVWPVQTAADAGELAKLISTRDNLLKQLGALDPSKPADLVTIRQLRLQLDQIGGQIEDRAGTPTCRTSFSNWEKQIADSSGTMDAHTHAPDPAVTPCQLAPNAGYTRLENQLYRVEIHKGGDRTTATFKWSRDNGSIVTPIDSFDVPNKKITIHDLGRDDVLGFANGQWAEITDDTQELSGAPGQLVVVAGLDKDSRQLTLPFAPTVVDQKFHPKLRRWDNLPSSPAGGILMTNDWIPIENGIEIKFSEGTYKTGDYWVIPARTNTGDIEWPPDSASGSTARAPLGIRHWYAKLALIGVNAKVLSIVSDCRSLFPPATALTGLYYVGGDGQDAHTDGTLQYPLEVGVANGNRPVAGARIRFHIVSGGGTLAGGAGPLLVLTGADGIARCDSWVLGNPAQKQQVQAELLVAGDNRGDLPIDFSATYLSADQVIYQPGKCGKTAGAKNVQDAIDQLCAPDPRIRIINLSVQNDLNMPAELFVKDGIVVTFDQPVLAVTAKRPTCFVTLEVPAFPGPAELQNQVAGHVLMRLEGVITIDSGRLSLRWRPTPAAERWILQEFPAMLDRYGNPPVLTRLTLKGNFIWGDRPDMFLDGEALGQLRTDSSSIDLRLPTGDGRSGGDFEMWFWLQVPRIVQPLKVAQVQLIRGADTILSMTDPKQPMSINLIGGASPTALDVQFSVAPANVNNQNFVVTPSGALTNLPAPLAGQITMVTPIRARFTPANKFPVGNFSVVLRADGPDPIKSQDGRILDGEPTQLPSGDGKDGGTFNFTLSITNIVP
jgi:hypothetical protein